MRTIKASQSQVGKPATSNLEKKLMAASGQVCNLVEPQLSTAKLVVSIGPESSIKEAIGHDILENESLDYLFSKVVDMI